jgi:hypothetical protein
MGSGAIALTGLEASLSCLDDLGPLGQASSGNADESEES